MAGKKIDIMDLRDLIRLKKHGFSNRKTALKLSTSRNTVNGYVRLIDSYKLDYTELLTLTDKQLLDLFPAESEVDSYRYKELSQYFSYFKRELKKPGCTQFVLWKQYLKKHPDGYMHTQFGYYFVQWLRKIKASGKLNHKAGEQLLVDFTGKKLQIVNKHSGEVTPINVFVCILPSSGYTFVKATYTQSTEDVIDALNSCLNYIGGVPLAIVPDNMKAAVTKSHKYAPKINPTLRDFAHHYGCVIDPTRIYSPRDKAMVEGAVKLVYQRIFYPLSKHTFFSIEELNKEIGLLLDKYNNMLFSQSNSTRAQEFLSLEKQYLQPLPQEAYLIRHFKKLKVQKMGYVYLADDKHYYSVPYRLIGRQVTVCYSHRGIEVYYKKDRVAIHKRDYRKGKYTTNEDHLSSSHKAYSQWSLEYFQSKAGQIGHHTQRYITELILQRAYPEMGYKQALGITLLIKLYPVGRVDKACQRAYGHGMHGYHIIENILKNGMDKQHDHKNDQTHIPVHQNIRGAKFYN